MLFSLIVGLMVILVAAFWTYQGFFSSAIMFFEALIAALAAFTFYESLNEIWVDSLGPGKGPPIALMLIFLVTLVVLRTMTDRYITKDVTMPPPVSRAGGAMCGFFSGMIMVGMAMIAIQMLPIGSAVFSFERMSYDTEKGGPAKASGLGIFSPDRFTYSLISSLSDGDRFGTDDDHALRRTKPDLITQLYSYRAVPQWEARVFLDERDIEAKAYWETMAIDKPTHKIGEGETMIREFKTIAPKRLDDKYLVCTVEIKKSAMQDKINQIRFRLPQFRVVGFDRGSEKETPSVYLATGITDIYTHQHLGPKPVADAQRERLVAFSPLINFILDPNMTKVIETDKGFQLDVAFEVPRDFKPWFIEFKSGARADMSGLKKLDSPPSWASVAMGKEGMSGATTNKEVGVAVVSTWDVPSNVVQKTGFTNKLPFEIDTSNGNVPPTIYTGESVGNANGVHFFYEIPLNKPSDLFAKEFWVPGGKQMFIVTFDDPKKKSMWGRSIQFASRVVGQTTITDAAGTPHFAIGQYAIAEIGGRWVYEIQYWPAADIPERSLQKPKRVTQQVLDAAGVENSYFGFIFLVPDSVTEIKEFQSGRGKPLELNIKR